MLVDAADPRPLGFLAAVVREAGKPVPGVVSNRPTVGQFNRVRAPLTAGRIGDEQVAESVGYSYESAG
ncbi:MAG: hypothetical protein ABIJ48_10000 [Actinomycetota bacterium]